MHLTRLFDRHSIFSIITPSCQIIVAFYSSHANPGEPIFSQSKMVARTDGIGQFAIEGNFELDQAVLEGPKLDIPW